MKLLLHVCCAPCSVYCVDSLRREGIEPDLFWYNPNIHPYTEYRRRRDTLRDYAGQLGLRLIEEDEYGLRPFVEAVSPDFENRCGYCYRTRLEATARYAAGHGYDAFTTTLHVSPYQNQELIRQTGEWTAGEYKIPYLYRDFSVGFREGQRAAREMGMYMQKYCGCVFSEEDRYLAKKKSGKREAL